MLAIQYSLLFPDEFSPSSSTFRVLPLAWLLPILNDPAQPIIESSHFGLRL
jgi:hypothetical protein